MMGTDPEFGRNYGMRRLSWLAWLPIPLLLAVTLVLWLADLRGSHESHFLGIALNLVFSTVASLFVAYLIARSFLVRYTAGLLLLGCGVVLWGLAGVVATAVAGDDVNVLIAIHNSCVWLSALCHLASVLLSLRPRRTLSPPGLWLPAAYAHAAVAVALIALSAHAGWLPTFFIQGQGGTLFREFVLGSAVAMFGLTALLLGVTSRRPLSPFAYWYALALALIAVGLFGVMLESSVASILGWTGRGTQFLSGVYMLIAAFASVRESRVWGISLEAALREERGFSSAVLDTAGALIVVLDAQGRITRFNRACEQLTGCPAADVLGRVFWDFLIPPEEMPGVMETWDSLNARDFPNRHENHWLTRDGTRRLIDWSNSALTDEAGEVRHIIAIGIDVTERRRAEETLRENQALVRAVVDGSPDLIYMKDLDGRVLMANPAACEALGRPAKEVLGKTAREFHSQDPDVGRSIMENDRRIMESAATETIEELGLNGRTYLSTKAPYRDAAGKVIGLLGISHDITDRKQAEHRLKADLTALTRIHDLSMKLLEAGGLEPLLQEIMDAAVAIMGAERGTLQLIEGGSLRIVAHCGHQRPFLKFFASAENRASVCGEAMKRGQRMVVEDIEDSPLFTGTASLKVLREAGVRAIQSTPLLDRQGTLLGILTTQWSVPYIPDEHDLWRIDLLARQAADLIMHKQAEEALRNANEDLRAQAEQLRTANELLQRKQSELEEANEQLREQEQDLVQHAEALQESEERYRTLFETAPDAIVVHRDGRFLHANGAALRLAGLSDSDGLASHTIFDFFGPREREQVAERIRLAMAGHRLPTREATLRRLDGQEVAVEFHTALVDFQGAPAVQTIIRDITERKQAEEALREWNATLEAKVAERTAELEHRAKQLQKLTLELSQAEDRERKRIAEILHEDLQQHIAGAKFHLSLLSHRVKDDPPKQAIVDRVDEMLKEAIQKSRSLSHDLSPAVLHMNDLGEVLHWLASRMKTKHDLAVQIDVGGEPTLQSEALTMFLFRAAQEMMFNVIKHAQVHEAAIRVRRLGRYLCMSVLDRGCGFDPRQLKETSGFGLLSIRERVKLLGGRMMIKSIKGRGSRFHIIVPDGRLDARPD